VLALFFFNSRYFFFNSRYFFFNICADTPEFIKVFLFRKAKSDFNSTVIRRIYRVCLGDSTGGTFLVLLKLPRIYQTRLSGHPRSLNRLHQTCPGTRRHIFCFAA